jgi:imidazolonepropionase-like amidohydrolase
LGKSFFSFERTRELRDAGVRLLAGTDTPQPFVYPGFSLHDELALLVKAGLTPLEALRTATYNPAEYLNALDSLGTVAPGKVADLVVLDANPLDRIQNTRRISAVIANGRLFNRAALDSLLRGVATTLHPTQGPEH